MKILGNLVPVRVEDGNGVVYGYGIAEDVSPPPSSPPPAPPNVPPPDQIQRWLFKFKDIEALRKGFPPNTELSWIAESSPPWGDNTIEDFEAWAEDEDNTKIPRPNVYIASNCVSVTGTSVPTTLFPDYPDAPGGNQFDPGGIQGISSSVRTSVVFAEWEDTLQSQEMWVLAQGYAAPGLQAGSPIDSSLYRGFSVEDHRSMIGSALWTSTSTLVLLRNTHTEQP